MTAPRPALLERQEQAGQLHNKHRLRRNTGWSVLGEGALAATRFQCPIVLTCLFGMCFATGL